VTSWFDESPETYDRARPVYPEPLWDEVFTRLPANPELVEIGPGPGKATGALLARGARVTACEPGPNLAAYLRDKFPSPQLHVQNSSFEDADIAPSHFDGVVAATSFHWVQQWARTTKTHSVLKPHGLLAVVDTEQVDDPVDRGYFAASQRVYRRYFDGTGPEPLPGRKAPPRVQREFSDYERFEALEVFHYDWNQRYETAGYIDLVRSYSNTAQMERSQRERFLNELAQFIDAEFDGYVVRPLVITLVLARARP
jgi:SAM-dependent methyltransferase